MLKRRPIGCRCTARYTCPACLSRLDAAFDRALTDRERLINPHLEADDGDVVLVYADGRSTSKPGDDDGYLYSKGRYARGFDPRDKRKATV